MQISRGGAITTRRPNEDHREGRRRFLAGCKGWQVEISCLLSLRTVDIYLLSKISNTRQAGVRLDYAHAHVSQEDTRFPILAEEE